jgi:hypothetical protein
MLKMAFIISALLGLAGCSEHARLDNAAPMAESAPVAKNATRSFMAYEHALTIDAKQEDIQRIFETAQQACKQAEDDACTILSSDINVGRSSSASIKFRAKKSGIIKIISALSKQGEVSNQTTTAEDLEAPISDNAKKLSMLKEYRTQLESLRSRAGSSVDALIKVNRELAQVQSDIESLEGSQMFLMRRVDTEILNVYIQSYTKQGFWSPIGYAFADFGKNLSQGISSAITSIAYLIPWILLLIASFAIIRKFWKRK